MLRTSGDDKDIAKSGEVLIGRVAAPSGAIKKFNAEQWAVDIMESMKSMPK
jgi:hypothetical protein